MHTLKRVSRTDTFYTLIFDDDSVRALDLAPYLEASVTEALRNEQDLRYLPTQPETHAIVFKDGSEISADFLYANSLLYGWVDKAWGLNAWQPLKFEKAQIKLEITNGECHAGLFLDGKLFPALLIGSASFGIYENTPWYQVSFPGDDGVNEPELEEPQIVFDTLDLLIRLTNEALEKKSTADMDISAYLQKTGRELFVFMISPRSSAIYSKRFKRKAA